MIRFLIAVTIAAATVSTPVLAADVGVSVTIGQPGFYGRLDITDFPQPKLLQPQPIIIDRRVRIDDPPLYLHVPPGHAKHWNKHCHKYNACGERVYFVRDDWYNQEYVPRYQERHREHRGNRDHYRKDNRGKNKHKSHNKGQGKSHGKGHNK